MRKRILPVLLVALVVLGSVVMAVGTERNIVPDMNFTGDAIHLSLDDAIEIMKTKGSRAEAAALNKASDEAIAKGHKESAESISEYLRNLASDAYDKVTISEIAQQKPAERRKLTRK